MRIAAHLSLPIVAHQACFFIVRDFLTHFEISLTGGAFATIAYLRCPNRQQTQRKPYRSPHIPVCIYVRALWLRTLSLSCTGLLSVRILLFREEEMMSTLDETEVSRL